MQPIHELPPDRRLRTVVHSAAYGEPATPTFAAAILRRLADPRQGSPAAIALLIRQAAQHGPGWVRLNLSALLDWLAKPCVSLDRSSALHRGGGPMQTQGCPHSVWTEVGAPAWAPEGGLGREGMPPNAALVAVMDGSTGDVGMANMRSAFWSSAGELPVNFKGVHDGGGSGAGGTERDAGGSLAVKARLLGLPPQLRPQLRQLLASLPRCGILYGSLDERSRLLLQQLLAELGGSRTVSCDPRVSISPLRPALASGIGAVDVDLHPGGDSVLAPGPGSTGLPVRGGPDPTARNPGRRVGGQYGGRSGLGAAGSWVAAAMCASRLRYQRQRRPAAAVGHCDDAPAHRTGAEATVNAGGGTAAGAGGTGVPAGTYAGADARVDEEPAGASRQVGTAEVRGGDAAAVDGGCGGGWWWIPGELYDTDEEDREQDTDGGGGHGGLEERQHLVADPVRFAPGLKRPEVAPGVREEPEAPSEFSRAPQATKVLVHPEAEAAEVEPGSDVCHASDKATRGQAPPGLRGLQSPRPTKRPRMDGATGSVASADKPDETAAAIAACALEAGGDRGMAGEATRSPPSTTPQHAGLGVQTGNGGGAQAEAGREAKRDGLDSGAGGRGGGLAASWAEVLKALQEAGGGCGDDSDAASSWQRIEALLEQCAAISYDSVQMAAALAVAGPQGAGGLTLDAVSYVVRNLVTPRLSGAAARLLLGGLVLPAVVAVERVMPKPLQEAMAAAAGPHPRPLAEVVLASAAQRPGLSAGQAQLLVKVATTGRNALPRPLQALVLCSAASVGAEWCDTHVAVVQGLVEAAKDEMDSATLAAVSGGLCAAAASRRLSGSVPLCRLLLSLLSKYGSALSAMQLQGLQEAAAATSTFMTKPCLAKLQDLLAGAGRS